MRVYKFYSSKWGRDALRKKRLKITTLHDINDPFEFIPINLKDRRFREPFYKMRDGMFEGRGVICFSQNWSNPVLWSHYGESHRGMVLGFDIPKKLMIEANYVSELYEPEQFIKDASSWIKSGDGSELSQTLCRVFATKYDLWEYENEVRLFVNIDPITKAGRFYFKDFDTDLILREVILGANYSKEVGAIDPVCLNQDIKLRTARIAFTKYKVTEQLHPNKQKTI